MLTAGTITIEQNSCWCLLYESSSSQESKNTLIFIMDCLLTFNLYEVNNLMQLVTRKRILLLETIQLMGITETMTIEYYSEPFFIHRCTNRFLYTGVCIHPKIKGTYAITVHQLTRLSCTSTIYVRGSWTTQTKYQQYRVVLLLCLRGRDIAMLPCHLL